MLRMNESALHGGHFDAGDHLELAAAAKTVLDMDGEHA